jgi:hypothetical protein
MNILDLVVGRPIKTSDERAEQIGPAQGIFTVSAPWYVGERT